MSLRQVVVPTDLDPALSQAEQGTKRHSSSPKESITTTPTLSTHSVAMDSESKIDRRAPTGTKPQWTESPFFIWLLSFFTRYGFAAFIFYLLITPLAYASDHRSFYVLKIMLNAFFIANFFVKRIA